jgi:hypothetical protein
MILVDDQLAAIGSVALAPLNLDFRREVAILIREPRCLSQLRGFFLASATARVAKASRAGDEEDEE